MSSLALRALSPHYALNACVYAAASRSAHIRCRGATFDAAAAHHGLRAMPTPPPPYALPAQAKAPKRPTREFKARQAAITMTPAAISRLRELLDSPEPKLIRVGVRNKGCAGMAYHLEYVDKAGSFDEVVKQDGIRVLIDSKALFSIIGSEMDWVEDAVSLSARFVFKNPNVKDACGCGESFNI